MAFLRVKRVRGRPYAYLVESVWDAARGQPRQKVRGYLGRLDRVRAEQLPGDPPSPELLRSLAEKQAEERQRVDAAVERHTLRVAERLLAGDPAPVRAAAREARRELGEDAGLRRVLAGAMREVGRRWADGRATISQEHLASSIVAGLLARSNRPLRSAGSGGPEVVVCVPEGEYHTLPLLLAERPLRERGYEVVNIGPSAPTESTIAFVRSRRPFGVLISVTQPACLEPARSLARRLHRELPRTRVVLGGQAVEGAERGIDVPGVDLCRDSLDRCLERWPAA
jgi:methanogenic corrinoid protein MtbC1